MSAKHLHTTILWLFVGVVAEALVAVSLRFGSIAKVAGGDYSWLTLVALGGLACLGLLLAVTVRAARDLLGLLHELTAVNARLTALESVAPTHHGRHIAVPADFGRDAHTARQRVLDLLHRGNLSIAMQPIIDLQSDTCVAAEALARFPDGRGPDAWFRDAQEMGLGVELELLALRTALTQVPALPENLQVSINASPSLILDPRMAQAIYDSGVSLERLALEITEHAAVTGYEEIKSALLLLRERGVQLAVDDTGAGYASFTHVLRLRPDVIKLDRSMVVDIAGDPAKRAFVTAVVLLALELDATITAEGIENAAELDTVTALGVDHAQGFHIGRPDISPATWRSWSNRRWTGVRDDLPIVVHHDA